MCFLSLAHIHEASSRLPYCCSIIGNHDNYFWVSFGNCTSRVLKGVWGRLVASDVLGRRIPIPSLSKNLTVFFADALGNATVDGPETVVRFPFKRTKLQDCNKIL